MKIQASIPVRRYRVPSKSEPGMRHLLVLWSDGYLECDCIAFDMGRECWHWKVVSAKALNDGYSVQGISKAKAT